jgi:transposase-like protein
MIHLLFSNWIEDKPMKPHTLQDAIKYFADPENCMDWLKAKRWPDGVPVCPQCGRGDATYLPQLQKWQCKSAHKSRQFSARVGTIFEDSPIALEKWLVALWMVCNCKNGISSYEIHRTIGVTQKTAWFMLHRIRLAMKSGSLMKLGGTGGPVEADETFVGPNPMRQHKKKRAEIQAIASNTYGMNRRAPGKTIVMGMVDREMREARAMVVPDVKRKTLQDKILNNISEGSQVITDDFTSYDYALAEKFVHQVINHAEGYVSGQIHTQGIENFWSLLKRGLRGTYIAVEPFHLDRYIDEQVFRYNNRGGKKKIDRVTDEQRFDRALSGVVGKRLTFAEVTGKVTPTPA